MSHIFCNCILCFSASLQCPCWPSNLLFSADLLIKNFIFCAFSCTFLLFFFIPAATYHFCCIPVTSFASLHLPCWTADLLFSADLLISNFAFFAFSFFFLNFHTFPRFPVITYASLLPYSSLADLLILNFAFSSLYCIFSTVFVSSLHFHAFPCIPVTYYASQQLSCWPALFFNTGHPSTS